MLRPASLPRRRALRRLVGALLLLPLAGCEDLGPDRARVVVRFQERGPFTRDRLVVTLSDERRDYYAEGLDFGPLDDGWWEARELRLGTRGAADVRVWIRGSGVEVAAATDLALPLAPFARWRVDVFASSASPATACGGCRGLRQLRLPAGVRPSAQDFLYVTWTSLAP